MVAQSFPKELRMASVLITGTSKDQLSSGAVFGPCRPQGPCHHAQPVAIFGNGRIGCARETADHSLGDRRVLLRICSEAIVAAQQAHGPIEGCSSSMPLLSDGSVEQLQLADSRAVMSATSVLIALDTPEEPADGCGLVWFTINPQRFVWRFLH